MANVNFLYPIKPTKVMIEKLQTIIHFNLIGGLCKPKSGLFFTYCRELYATKSIRQQGEIRNKFYTLLSSDKYSMSSVSAKYKIENSL